MRIEVKGLLLAIVAALVVLGATFGTAALVKGTGGAGRDHHHRASAPSGGSASGPVSAALVAQGQGFYAQGCASCHGPDGKGAYGPNLHNEDMSDAQIAAIIKNGVKGRMPAFGSKYNDVQTQALVGYIRALK